MCDFDWVGPFWGGDPEVPERHNCVRDEGHDGQHRCACGEPHEPADPAFSGGGPDYGAADYPEERS